MPSIEQQAAEAMLAGKVSGGSALVIVHSAFSGLSRNGLKAEKFCEALITAINGGSLLMPTMTWRTVTPEHPVFDEIATPSHTGVLTEVFRTGFATHRSLHATHSVAGKGPLAARLFATHHEGTTPCAGNSPYGLMRDYDAWILMIGLGLDHCTAFHHAEEVMAEDVYVEPAETALTYRLRDRTGRVHRVVTRRHRRILRDFPSFEPLLVEQGSLTRGEILGVPWRLVNARGLYAALFQALSADPRATLASPDARAAARG